MDQLINFQVLLFQISIICLIHIFLSNRIIASCYVQTIGTCSGIMNIWTVCLTIFIALGVGMMVCA